MSCAISSTLDQELCCCFAVPANPHQGKEKGAPPPRGPSSEVSATTAEGPTWRMPALVPFLTKTEGTLQSLGVLHQKAVWSWLSDYHLIQHSPSEAY